MKINKIGFVFRPQGDSPWWKTHAMAPAPIRLNQEVIRVFLGCWDAQGISRIGYVDVSASDPTHILATSPAPILDIGQDGCFDENGVFPAHAFSCEDGRVFLYTTGFQLGHKIRHYNFGGLAVSEDGGHTFKRWSQAPLLDRADEGLFVRAGQSIEKADGGGFHVVYSAGSGWHPCGGELRPVYDVFYQHSPDGIQLSKTGRKIVSCDMKVEHGLGRPQIIRFGEYYYVFYTRRIIEDMRYFMGCARSKDGASWERMDHALSALPFGETGAFDAEMAYFPAVLKLSEDKAYLLYSGNHYGEAGLGAALLSFDEHS